MIFPQFLLCGPLVPRQRMRSVLHAISDVLPLSYAVDGMHHLTRSAGAPGALIGDVMIVLGFAMASLPLGASTLRRRTT